MNIDPSTTVAFTGHRSYDGTAGEALRRTVGELAARGFRTFLCGMAVGFDLAGAEAVLACRDASAPCGADLAARASSASIPPAPAAFPDTVASSGPSFPDALTSSGRPLIPSSAFPDVPAFSGAASLAVPFTPVSLRLVAVVPFAGQEARFSAAERERFRRILDRADATLVLSPAYRVGCYAARNNYLVDHASVLVAWYDGSHGGTHYTVRRALARGLEIVNLHLRTPERLSGPASGPTLF